ncbi:MAG: UDP-3-O-acyl-N-acetylglucosamine deacetylase, partial [Pseudomonadota bacterium]
HDGRMLDIEIDFEDPAIGAQAMSIDLDDPAAMRRLAHARTFCRLADVTAMRAAGLSLGGSLDNAIVIDGDRILNPAGLRDPKEFVLHKALDLLGDLRLAEVPIIGRITARRPGHELNTRFVRRLLAERGAYDRVLLNAPEARVSA